MEYNFVLFVGILLILGLASSRVMRIFKMPNVTGYLIVGLIAALICIIVESSIDKELNFTEQLTKLNEFVSTVALGFIALSIGEEFKISKFKELGTGITIITFAQAFVTVVAVDIFLVIICLALNVTPAVAICLGAISAATAPAATIMVINQYKARGPLVDILLPVVAFDDAIGLIIFAVSSSIGASLVSGAELTVVNLLCIPLIEIFGSIAVGFILGVSMHWVMKYFKSRNNHEVVIIAFTLLGVGLCELLSQIKIQGTPVEFSNLLTCMMIGATYVNVASEEEGTIVDRDFGLIDRWTPFLFMLFFVLSGSHLALTAEEMFFSESSSGMLGTVVIIFVVYILVRSFGKYAGAYLGAKVTKSSDSIRKYLGITLLPQAGVAIGMANQISGMQAFKVDNVGSIIVTVVLCATLFYELVGPLMTKWALKEAGEIPEDAENN